MSGGTPILFLFLPLPSVGLVEGLGSPIVRCIISSGVWWTSVVRVFASVAVRLYRGSFPRCAVWVIFGSTSIWRVAESLFSR